MYWWISVIALIVLALKLTYAWQRIQKQKMRIDAKLAASPIGINRSEFYNLGLKVQENDGHIDLWSGLDLNSVIEKRGDDKRVVVVLETTWTSWNFKAFFENHYYQILLWDNGRLDEVFRARNRTPKIPDEIGPKESVIELADVLALKLGVPIKKVLISTGETL